MEQEYELIQEVSTRFGKTFEVVERSIKYESHVPQIIFDKSGYAAEKNVIIGQINIRTRFKYLI